MSLRLFFFYLIYSATGFFPSSSLSTFALLCALVLRKCIRCPLHIEPVADSLLDDGPSAYLILAVSATTPTGFLLAQAGNGLLMNLFGFSPIPFILFWFLGASRVLLASPGDTTSVYLCPYGEGSFYVDGKYNGPVSPLVCLGGGRGRPEGSIVLIYTYPFFRIYLTFSDHAYGYKHK